MESGGKRPPGMPVIPPPSPGRVLEGRSHGRRALCECARLRSPVCPTRARDLRAGGIARSPAVRWVRRTAAVDAGAGSVGSGGAHG